MKRYSKIVAILALLSGSLMPGYIIMHSKDSKVPGVDIYVYRANSPEEAERIHKKFGTWLQLPKDVLDILDKIRGVSAPTAEALAKETKGVIVKVQKGVDVGVTTARRTYSAFEYNISTLIGKIYRSMEEALHKDVPRGNRGRFAEKDVKNVMYAIVTLPDNIAPLHADPVRIEKDGKIGFAILATDDPDIPGNKIYEAVFDTKYANEYVPSSKDKRIKDRIRDNAKISGDRAAQLPGQTQATTRQPIPGIPSAAITPETAAR